MSKLKPTIFRVIRQQVDGLTVRILLEPYSDDQHVNLSEGDEFITGGLTVNPWDSEPKR